MNNIRLAITGLLLLTMVHLEAAKPKSAKKERATSGKIFNKNIYDLAHENTYFRKELVTGEHSQVVIMSIPVGGEIGMERHHVDQTLVFVDGEGQAIINGEISDLYADHLVFVPAGAEHNFKNTGDTELKLFTIYAPPQHKPGTEEKVKGKKSY